MGYQLRPRYEEFECPASVLPFEEGDEPFRATIRTNLTFDEVDALPRGKDMTFGQVFDALHSYVVAWNWTATDQTSGEEVPVPPPAESGREAFSVLPQEAVVWLLAKVRLGHLGGDKRLKASPLPGDTDVPGSDESREPVKMTSQKRRTG